MATGLSDAQWDALDQVIDQVDLPFGAVQTCSPSVREALRLYASLSPGQQQSLWQGKAIDGAAMSPAQHALFLTGLREEIRRWYQPIPVDLSRWQHGSFRLAQVRMLRTRLSLPSLLGRDL
jgi:hypothetical protein